MSVKVFQTKVMTLQDALTNYRDTNNNLVSFTQIGTTGAYTGTGSDGYVYFVNPSPRNVVEVSMTKAPPFT